MDSCARSSLRLALLLILACALFGCSSDRSTEARAGSTNEALSGAVVATGVDYSFARPSPGALYSEGYTFAARYLSPPPNGKNLSSSEADALWAAKVDVVVVFEQGAQNVLGGHAQGVADAQVADSQSKSDGMPAGRPIYFAIDFDAQPGDYPAIDAYFDGVASVIGLDRTGVYAGINPVTHLFDAGKIKWAWQTYAWSGGAWDSRAQLRQVLNDITAGGDPNCCDKDEAVSKDYGQWHVGPVDPCTYANGDGYYCGASPQFMGGSMGHLYHCVNNVTAGNTLCAAGCIVEPPGMPDKCAAEPDGGSDAGHHGDASSGGDSGSGGAGGGGPAPDAGDPGSGGNGGAAGSDNGSTPDTTQASSGCSTAGPTSGAGGAWLAVASLALGLVVAARRRRRSP